MNEPSLHNDERFFFGIEANDCSILLGEAKYLLHGSVQYFLLARGKKWSSPLHMEIFMWWWFINLLSKWHYTIGQRLNSNFTSVILLTWSFQLQVYVSRNHVKALIVHRKLSQIICCHLLIMAVEQHVDQFNTSVS